MNDAHLSLDELAELAEGLLARRKAAAAQAHLKTCDSCRARADALERTTADLHDLGTVAMPADVVARLDRALAGAAQVPPGETVVPDLDAIRRRRLAAVSWPYAAAASVAVIAVIAVGVTAIGRHHNGPTRESAGAASARVPLVGTTAPRQPLVQQESGQTYTPTSLAALAPQLLGATSNSFGRAAGVPVAPLHAAAPDSQAPQSATGLAPAAPTPSAAKAGGALPGAAGAQEFSAEANVPAPLRHYADSRSALLACAAYITDTPHAAPLAVDFARWSNPSAHLHDAPSVIFVFADPDDTHLLDVYVVAPACDSASLRDFTEVPRS